MHLITDRRTGFDMQALNRRDWQQLTRSGGDEHFIGRFQVLREERFLADFETWDLHLFKQHPARDAGEATGRLRRRPYAITLSDENIG